MPCGEPLSAKGMGLSDDAADILAELPEDKLLYTDTSSEVNVRLPAKAKINGRALLRWPAATINMRSRMVTIYLHHLSSSPVKASSPQKSGLSGTTASEQRAIKLADRMGCIDLDNLVPKFELSSSDGRTCLAVSRLLRVDDAKVRAALQDISCDYQYDLEKRKVLFYFESDNKRKRESSAQ